MYTLYDSQSVILYKVSTLTIMQLTSSTSMYTILFVPEALMYICTNYEGIVDRDVC